MLSLSNLGINLLPSSINKLKHLRYLDLSYNNDIKKLPESITHLYNLQVLKLSRCNQLIQLPKGITNLVNLGHLHNDLCYGLTHMPRGIGQLTQLEKLSTFVIAKDDSISKNCGGLEELHALNNLRGALTIMNLRYVRHADSEFKAADLEAKQQLQELTLYWDYYEDDHENCSLNDVANDEMGLEALRPHQSLKGFAVISYRGVRSPSWLPSLNNLVSIDFFCCNNIEWLPAFDQLPYLKRFWLFTLTNLERIEVAVNFEKGGSSSFFPSLESIHLTDCPNLRGFLRYGTDFGMDEFPCFPCVSELKIGGCSKLAYTPHVPELKKLDLRKDGLESLKEILKMTTSASNTASSPFSALSQLQVLRIIGMGEFQEEELLQYLTSLQELYFLSCEFESLSSDGKDEGMQWRSLQVLKSVSFVRALNLVSLPKGLRYVTTLKSLIIRGCPHLLSIPEWMDNLSTLQYLRISGCPQLSDRCKNRAEDWPKICHIPDISIDEEEIQKNGCYLL